jgi:hypothetical protein
LRDLDPEDSGVLSLRQILSAADTPSELRYVATKLSRHHINWFDWDENTEMIDYRNMLVFGTPIWRRLLMFAFGALLVAFCVFHRTWDACTADIRLNGVGYYELDVPEFEYYEENSLATEMGVIQVDGKNYRRSDLCAVPPTPESYMGYLTWAWLRRWVTNLRIVLCVLLTVEPGVPLDAWAEAGAYYVALVFPVVVGAVLVRCIHEPLPQVPAAYRLPLLCSIPFTTVVTAICEGWNVMDGLYFCITTATYAGARDLPIETLGGEIGMIWTLVGVSALLLPFLSQFVYTSARAHRPTERLATKGKWTLGRDAPEFLTSVLVAWRIITQQDADAAHAEADKLFREAHPERLAGASDPLGDTTVDFGDEPTVLADDRDELIDVDTPRSNEPESPSVQRLAKSLARRGEPSTESPKPPSG